MSKIRFLVPILCLALAACGTAQSGAPSGSQPTTGATAPTQATPSVTPQQLETMPPQTLPTLTAGPSGSPQLATPLASPVRSPILPDPAQPDEALTRAAQTQLARILSRAPETLKLQSATAQTWSDGSLGCPEDGVMYPQVLTPGFMLTFSDGARTYTVHTGQSKEQMVLCENQKPTDLSGPAQQPDIATPPPLAPSETGIRPPALVPTTDPSAGENVPLDETTRPLVDQAKNALARDLNMATDQITLRQLEQVEWNDGSLGCPKPGEVYLQVITPGYRIVLVAQGQTYEYHTDRSRRVVRCDTP